MVPCRKASGPFLTWSLSGLVLLLLGSPAAADSNSVGVNFTTIDRRTILVSKNAKVKVSAHSFDTGVILGLSGEYSNTAFSNSGTVKLEGTVGYRAELGDRFSVTGSGIRLIHAKVWTLSSRCCV